MILLDAYALVAYLLDEPAAPEVETMLRGGDAAITPIQAAETIDVSQRVHGLPAGRMRVTLEPLLGEIVQIREQGLEDAWRAAEIRASHYDARTCALSLADCFLVAAAGPGDSIATADRAVATTARAEQLQVIALRASSGRLPE